MEKAIFKLRSNIYFCMHCKFIIQYMKNKYNHFIQGLIFYVFISHYGICFASSAKLLCHPFLYEICTDPEEVVKSYASFLKQTMVKLHSSGCNCICMPPKEMPEFGTGGKKPV